ncbi:MAG: hypothetical protein H7039_06195 [Bryobacteraceae bacterium]|nr:hypothetical protein [Bryobacteraceae bacterium]
MYPSIVRNLLYAVVLAAGLPTLSLSQPVPARGVLTNRDVITLAKAGFDDRFIADVIEGSRRRFDLSADALANLAEHGIDHGLIQFMMLLKNERFTPPAASAQETAVEAKIRIPEQGLSHAGQSPVVAMVIVRRIDVAAQTPFAPVLLPVPVPSVVWPAAGWAPNSRYASAGPRVKSRRVAH